MACLLFMDIADTILCTADVFIWMEWRVVVISFPDSTFDVVESIVNPMPSRFYLTLFSRSFIVLYSISCAVIHFELVVWKVWGICLDSFILCAVLYSFQGHFLKRLCSLSVFSWLVLHEFASELSILIHWLNCLSFHWYHVVLITECIYCLDLE